MQETGSEEAAREIRSSGGRAAAAEDSTKEAREGPATGEGVQGVRLALSARGGGREGGKPPEKALERKGAEAGKEDSFLTRFGWSFWWEKDPYKENTGEDTKTEDGRTKKREPHSHSLTHFGSLVTFVYFCALSLFPFPLFVFLRVSNLPLFSFQRCHSPCVVSPVFPLRWPAARPPPSASAAPSSASPFLLSGRKEDRSRNGTGRSHNSTQEEDELRLTELRIS